MEIALLALLAQTAPPATPLQSVMQFAPVILVVLVMYFFVFNSKRKDEKSRKTMIDQLKKGDRIQTIGGILGTVVTTDGVEIVVKVDETSNTKVRFVRSAVHKVLTDDGKADAK